jgi:hypothetical protein
MKNKNFIFIFILLITLIVSFLLIYKIAAELPFQRPNINLGENESPISDQTSKPTQDSQQATTGSENKNPPKNLQYWRDQLKDCPNEAESFKTFQSEIETLIENPLSELSNEVKLIQNWHIRLKNNETHRLQLVLSHSSNLKPIHELKYFSETSEGLPWPIKIPKEDQINPNPETLNKYLQKGDLIFSQSIKELLKEGERLTWTVTRDQLQEINWCQ